MVEQCPKCGAAGKKLFAFSTKLVFECGSDQLQDGRMWQSDACKLRVAERELSEVKAERDGLLRRMDDAKIAIAEARFAAKENAALRKEIDVLSERLSEFC